MSARMKIAPGWFSLEGAATYTGFSITSIRAAAAAEKFPVKRVVIRGNGAKDSARIKREHLDAWIEGREMPVKSPTPRKAKS